MAGYYPDTIGEYIVIIIYCIRNLINNKRYIGQTTNYKQRMSSLKSQMRSRYRNIKGINENFYKDAKKYGMDNFEFSILEKLNSSDRKKGLLREYFWMEKYNSTNIQFGYNLRADTSTGMIVHPLTRQKYSAMYKGEQNPNYGNKWDDEQKERMSAISTARHASGNIYTDKWRSKISQASSETWKNEDLKKQMAKAVSEAKATHDFYQYTRSGEFVKKWDSLAEILKKNPEYKWQNIYAACNGNKPTYRNFVWKRVAKND